jgi:hypothetical protein
MFDALNKKRDGGEGDRSDAPYEVFRYQQNFFRLHGPFLPPTALVGIYNSSYANYNHFSNSMVIFKAFPCSAR